MYNWWSKAGAVSRAAKYPTHDILVVAENDKGGNHPMNAVFPAPRNTIGHKFMTCIGMPQRDFMGLWRANLCTEGWSDHAAVQRAEALWGDGFRAIIMLGFQIANSFGYEGKPFTYVPDISNSGDPTLIYLPKPGSKLWNDAKTPERTLCLLKAAIPGYQWTGLK